MYGTMWRKNTMFITLFVQHFRQRAFWIRRWSAVAKKGVKKRFGRYNNVFETVFGRRVYT